jgi:pilus assembly protein CpaD
MTLNPVSDNPAQRSNAMAVTLKTPRGRNGRFCRVATVIGALALLSGCGNLGEDRMSTGSIDNDYRQRHPITLTEVEHAVDVPIASGDRSLTQGTRDMVGGFADNYRKSASGNLQVLIPNGAYNSGAASVLSREVRSVLIGAGVPSNRIILTSYRSSPNTTAPIRLTYVATTAVTSECGQWPEDIANNTKNNQNWHNFGCATQNNLAAQIENPTDLIAPRRSAQIDAAERANVIKVYRDGGTTTTTSN